jgi:hypothetical protein
MLPDGGFMTPNTCEVALNSGSLGLEPSLQVLQRSLVLVEP